MPAYRFKSSLVSAMSVDEHVELPNLLFAQREALRRAGQMMEVEAGLQAMGQDWRVEVAEPAGRILFRLEGFYPAGGDLGARSPEQVNIDVITAVEDALKP